MIVTHRCLYTFNMAYTLRSTSLVGEHLDAALARHGARTSGTTEQKQARLQRFLEATHKQDASREALTAIIVDQQRKIYERGQQRANEILAANGLLDMQKGTHLFFE